MSGLAEVLQPIVWTPSLASLGIDLGCNISPESIGYGHMDRDVGHSSLKLYGRKVITDLLKGSS